ncbi:MAG TPA: hypothetical protein VG347_24645, partial [Verrucomicrobiae bacterium]|nr:hypothetical protein [Verrucomicrobiae bacterium]
KKITICDLRLTQLGQARGFGWGEAFLGNLRAGRPRSFGATFERGLLKKKTISTRFYRFLLVYTRFHRIPLHFKRLMHKVLQKHSYGKNKGKTGRKSLHINGLTKNSIMIKTYGGKNKKIMKRASEGIYGQWPDRHTTK